MPGDPIDDEYDEDGWPQEQEEDEPMSADEAQAAPARPRRRPPMPKVPKPANRGPGWKPPWPVDKEGNALGVPLARDGDPPGTEVPEGFDPPAGTAEAAAKMMAPR